MTTQQVCDKLGSRHVSKRKGIFKYWQSYFWGVTKSADKLIQRVKDTIPNAVIVDSGNHLHGFVGGAKSGSKQDSHLWVTFTIPETTTTRTEAMLPIGCLTNDGKLVTSP